MKNEITNIEMYAFIGILILFGITKKTKIPIEELGQTNLFIFALSQ